MEPITILLADDHRMIRETWSFILKDEARFKVVGTAENGQQLLGLAAQLRPNIILTDINMSPLDGFEATTLIQRISPESKIIGVSMHAQPTYARKMIQLGAMGYVTKNSSRDELITAILEVSAGKEYICKEVKDKVEEQESDGKIHASGITSLSKREIQVAQEIKKGFSSKEIAITLGLRPKTVEVHRYNISKKLGINNVAALIKYLNENAI